MKIFQFTPSPMMNKVLTQSPTRTERTAGGGTDFASVLKAAFTRPSSEAGGVISLENHRALQLPPPGDLGQAGRLLGRLDNDIRSATPEVLNSLHNFEGLVYVYSKN